MTDHYWQASDWIYLDQDPRYSPLYPGVRIRDPGSHSFDPGSHIPGSLDPGSRIPWFRILVCNQHHRKPGSLDPC